MGFFSSLFGGKKEVNVVNILKTIDGSGGQGIAQVPIEVFAKYLHENGEQRPSQAGTVEGFINIDGKKRKVAFQHGMFQGLQEGETLITVFGSSGIEDNIDNIDPKSLADGLSGLIKKFIANENDACSIAYQMFVQSNMAYNGAYMAKGEPKFPSEEQYPASLQSFLNKVSADDMLKEEYQNLSPDLDFFEINDVFNSLTRDVSDPETQLIINYAIVENIIQEWGLDK
jgi:hypothetical protein